MRTPTITSISQGGNYISQLGKQEGTNRESAFPEASMKMSLSRSAVRDAIGGELGCGSDGTAVRSGLIARGARSISLRREALHKRLLPI